jgi:hypothetical protein
VSTFCDICETFCSVTPAMNHASHLCCRMFTVEIWTGTPTVLSEVFRASFVCLFLLFLGGGGFYRSN